MSALELDLNMKRYNVHMLEVAGLHEVRTSDQLEDLADQIATFAARIDVAKHALITRLRIFDAHEAWAHTGFVSCAHWLSWRTNIGVKAAREQVRVARALGTLPKIDALFGRGELSYSKVRAITRAATPETEQDFVDIAAYATAAQIERLCGSYRRCRTDASQPGELPRDQRRFVRRSETRGGMIRIEMQLPPEEAATVWEAMNSATDTSPPDPGQASAEASAAPAVAALPANDDRSQEEQRADAIVDVARAYLQHRPRTLGSAYELVLFSSKAQLEHGPGGVGGFLRDGTPVPLHAARMLAADGARVDVTLGEHGELLDVGRRTRTIPSAIARGLWLRDSCCRAPGCGRKRHLHAHHIQPWAQGGPTKLSNLVLVCSTHHRMIHEGVLSTEIRAGKITFIDHKGRELPNVAPSAATGHDLEELELVLRNADLHIDAKTGYPQWDGTPMNLDDSLTWLLMAHS